MSSDIKRKLAAIMFTDIAGFTKLSAKNESQALKLLDDQKDILTPIIKKFNGTLHKEMGDGLLLTFTTVSESVQCGIEIQKATKSHKNLNLRIGIHEGEITFKDGDVFGDDVNIASRIEGFAPTGGISLSDKVHKDISGVSDIKTSFIGHRKLKGVEQETKIRCITSDELPKHRKQIFPLIMGYYAMILGGLNAFLIFSLIIYSAFIGFKLHFMWMCAFIIDFTLIFIGYSCLSYVRGISIKAQRLFVYLGYFIIISTILSAIAMKYEFLFYLPPTEIMLPF